jgi:hypothetical protein
MNRDRENLFTKIAVGLLVGAVVLSLAVYAFSFLMPYLLFYVFPFLLTSTLVGFILWFSVRNDIRESNVEKNISVEFQYVSKFKFRRLAIAIPVLSLIVFLIFEAHRERRELIGQDGQVKGTYIEWDMAQKTFSNMRKNWYRDSMFESLRTKSKKIEIYDRSEIGYIFWMSLIFGGPGIFFWLSKDAEGEELNSVTNFVKEKVRSKEDQIQRVLSEQNEIAKGEKRVLEELIKRLQRKISEVKEENQRLKAKMEFLPQVTLVKSNDQKGEGPGNGSVLSELKI